MNRAIAIARNPRLWRLGIALAVFAVLLGSAIGAIADRATDPKVRLERARDLAFAHKPEAALRELRRVLAEVDERSNPELRLSALARMAQVLDTQLGDSHAKDALAAHKRVWDEFPESDEAFESGIRMGEIMRQRLGNDLHAENQFLAVVKAFPAHPGVEKVLLRAARIAEENRRYEEAKAYALRLQNEYSGSALAPEAQSIVGEVLHLEGRHAEAVKAYQVVSNKWPRTERAARALFEAGNCLAEVGDLSHAIGHYIESLSDHPDPLSVQRNLERVRRRFTAVRQTASATAKEAAFDRNRFSMH
jgi:TolA-binding protein